MNLVFALVMLGGGATLMWAGFADPEGGVIEGLRRALNDEPALKRTSTVGASFIAQAVAVGTGGDTTTGGGGADPDIGTRAPAGTRAKVIEAARTWLGAPYRLGGNTRAGVDCSGLTVAVYRLVGVNLPRVSFAQSLVGVRITQAQAQPGDLVFFGLPVHHVAIYVGADTILHAPKPGGVVRYEAIWRSEPVVFRNVLDGATPRRRKKRKKRKPKPAVST